jgi:uncharacterized membrane protein
LSKAGSSERKVSLLWAYAPVGVLVILAIAELIVALTEIRTAQFSNEELRLYYYVFIGALEAIELHLISQALPRMDELAEMTSQTYSFGIHLCNCKRERRYRWRGKYLPLCARHLGFYGSLFVSVISYLLLPASWRSFALWLPPNVSLAVSIILITLVAVEGGLGKRGHLHQTKNVRFIGGIETGLAIDFFFIALYGFFATL